MRPTLAILLTLVCCLAFAACRGGAESSRAPAEADTDEVLAEVNSFTAELMRKFETASDPSVGLEQAQQLLNGRKTELASKISALRKSGAIRSDETARARLLESEVENVRNISTLRTKLMTETMRDERLRERLDYFVNDYEALWRE
jgi:predicted RNase H-like nuclease (RuvC/YqgF family)